jgi:putative ABC transport system ATP-binding protein
MLELRDISLKLGGKQLFSHLSLSIDKGQVVCVTGDSGTGKTTLLRLILGFLPVNDGVISIDGELINSLSAETFRRMMMYVPQELALPSELVSDMVKMPFTLKANKDVKFSKEKLMKEWMKLDLDAALYDSQVSKISGGQRQRIMLSVCGMLNKSVLLVDEPTSALDSTCVRLVASYFHELASQGTMVIAVSHDSVFSSYCDKVININNGNN